MLARLPAALLLATLAAEAVLFPISATIFSRVTFAGLAVNFVAIPAMALAQIAGMLTIVVALVSEQAASVVAWLAVLGAEALVRSADLVELAPFLTWRLAPPNWVVIAAYYVSIIAALSVSFTKLVRQSAVVIAMAAAFWILAQPWRLGTAWGDSRLHVTFVDVGQGDATLVRFPRGSMMVVDAGGRSGPSSFDVGDRVVAPVLRQIGVRRLDTLALTHGDADHVGGARALIEEFRPRDVWEGIPVPPFEPLKILRATALRGGGQVGQRPDG
jgi:competence protein ComEC